MTPIAYFSHSVSCSTFQSLYGQFGDVNNVILIELKVYKWYLSALPENRNNMYYNIYLQYVVA